MNNNRFGVGPGPFAVAFMIVAQLSLSSARADIPAGPNVVNVISSDFSFDMPDSLPAGPTLFHHINNGEQLHHVTLVKLEQGKTLSDFTALPPGPFPSWAVLVGGPNTPTPQQGHVDDIVDLAPGNYVAICVIPDSDGVPHIVKGMIKALTVTSSDETRAMPASDITLTLSTYAFNFSSPLTAGHHVINVVNNGDQPHEAVMFRLQPGKKGEDIAEWVEGGLQGPPPGMPITGVSPMDPHEENRLVVDLPPGEYALLCFVPDTKDGKYHIAHGMIHNFQVSEIEG